MFLGGKESDQWHEMGIKPFGQFTFRTKVLPWSYQCTLPIQPVFLPTH